MKLYKQIIFILVVFFKTETLLSQNNLFNVNNIELVKKDKITNNQLADQAIKKGFKQLMLKILLKKDADKLLATDLFIDPKSYTQRSTRGYKLKDECVISFNN